jgi:hypothetical protein
MTYHRWRRRRSLRLRRRCRPWRHSPWWGLPSSWRCPRRQRLVSLAGRWGRSAETLTWMAGWRRWCPVSSGKWWWRSHWRPSPRHHRCCARIALLEFTGSPRALIPREMAKNSRGNVSLWSPIGKVFYG